MRILLVFDIFSWKMFNFVMVMQSPMSRCLFVCLSVCEQDYAKSLQAIFTKSFRIMGYCYENNRLNFVFIVVDSSQSGRMTAILPCDCM